MKINYNLEEKYMKFYNEANGIFLLKRKLKKNPNIKIRSYLSYITLQKILFIIFYMIMLLINFYMKAQNNVRLTFIIMSISIFAYFFKIAKFFLFVNRNINKEGVLEINEEGIFDKAKDGIHIGVPYKFIELIVITEDLIVIIANYSLMFLIDNKENDKDKITNKIREYSDIEIIDKTND